VSDSVFEKNSKRSKKSSVASTQALSALPFRDAPEVEEEERGRGGGKEEGGWTIWNSIINKHLSQKNSASGLFQRLLKSVKESYILILIGMVIIFVTLVTLKPSFVLGARVSRWQDPSLDFVRVSCFTVLFGVVSFSAISFLNR
tara:strand:- start:2763 stop:3194 length:432 start_codon:yes stop_codon:yes gene_type:complete